MIDTKYTPQEGDLLTTTTHWVEVHEVGDEVYYASGRHGADGTLYRKPYEEFVKAAREQAEKLERSDDEAV